MKLFSQYIFLFALFCLFLFIIFHSYFFPITLSGGDWTYYFPETIKSIVPFSSWSSLNFGLGSSLIPVLWLESYVGVTLPAALVIGWKLYERIFWFWPIVGFSFFSSYFLYRKSIAKNNYGILAGLIYTTNTYILMVIGGGQVGIAMAYALAPLVLYSFLRVRLHQNIRSSLIAGLALAMLTVFDIRITYMLLICVGVFVICLCIQSQVWNSLSLIKNYFLYFLILPIITSVLLHLYWILPLLISHENPFQQVTQSYTSTSSLSFFSFAKFEDTLSLLHPNWPENIFGKVYFLRPEFLILPILAFGSLLFANSKFKTQKHDNNVIIIFFVLIGLLGAFLAKGTQDPFGHLYTLLYQYIPGFDLFRDPTKWYLLIAISYSILIPYTIDQLAEVLKPKEKFSISNFQFSNKFKNLNFKLFVPTFFVLIYLFTIRQAVFGQLTGTFHPVQISSEYIHLKNVVSKDSSFSRTLWIPTKDTFAFFSEEHPAISATDLFPTLSSTQIEKKLQKTKSLTLLQDASIKYVIIPQDIDKKIFILDRKYSENVYANTVAAVDKISYLKKVMQFGKIVVYQVPKPKPEFFGLNALNVISKRISPTQYQLKIHNSSHNNMLIFSQTFDKNWELHINGKTVLPTKYELFDAYSIPTGNYSANITYAPQVWVEMGGIISGITFIGIVGYIFFMRVAK